MYGVAPYGRYPDDREFHPSSGYRRRVADNYGQQARHTYARRRVRRTLLDAEPPERTMRFSDMSNTVAKVKQSLAAISLKHDIDGLAILLGLLQELDQRCKVTGHIEVFEKEGRADAWKALHTAYVERILDVLRSIERNCHAHNSLTGNGFFQRLLKNGNGRRGHTIDIATFLLRPSNMSDTDWRTKLCDYIEQLSTAVREVSDRVDQAANDQPSGINGTIAKTVNRAEQRRLNASRRYG